MICQPEKAPKKKGGEYIIEFISLYYLLSGFGTLRFNSDDIEWNTNAVKKIYKTYKELLNDDALSTIRGDMFFFSLRRAIASSIILREYLNMQLSIPSQCAIQCIFPTPYQFSGCSVDRDEAKKVCRYFDSVENLSRLILAKCESDIEEYEPQLKEDEVDAFFKKHPLELLKDESTGDKEFLESYIHHLTRQRNASDLEDDDLLKLFNKSV